MCVTCGCSDNGEVTITNVNYEPNSDQPHPNPPLTKEREQVFPPLTKGGLGGVNSTITQVEETHTHTLADGTVITHSHNHNHPAEIHAKIHNKTITLEQEILSKNDLIAAENRGWFNGRNILALNLVSSPGAGKTTLLCRTIKDLKNELNISVIEGDQETVNDAEKIRETGCKVVQINTGTGCHLEAAMVKRGYIELNPPLNSVLMIENVGNLVCPALFDLGEKAKVVILSVTEGEDKPIKYPHMFRESEVMILNKIDLLPYVQFDVEKCLEYAKKVNPQIQIFQVSATTGEGLENWYEWLKISRKQSE